MQDDNLTQRWLRKRWPAIRARGFTHFMLVKGVLIWGGIMFVLMTAMTAYRLGTDNPRLPLVIALAAVLCAIGGTVWAALTWSINERIFKTLKSEPKA